MRVQAFAPKRKSAYARYSGFLPKLFISFILDGIKRAPHPAYGLSLPAQTHALRAIGRAARNPRAGGSSRAG